MKTFATLVPGVQFGWKAAAKNGDSFFPSRVLRANLDFRATHQETERLEHATRLLGTKYDYRIGHV